MSDPASINSRIVSALFCEALVLSDEVRHAFDRSESSDVLSVIENPEHIALSCEGLRTTTRMMHALAWLLNYRAYLMGELSELQLRRHGRLSPNLQEADPDNLALLDPEICDIIDESTRFYMRLLRLDNRWLDIDPQSFDTMACPHERVAGQTRF